MTGPADARYLMTLRDANGGDIPNDAIAWSYGKTICV
jgi:hypothetical protein